MTLKDFNKAINIDMPKESEIEKNGFMGLIDNATGGGLTSSQEKARDARRKSDLRSLKAALEIYKDDTA
jgi:hypothetical protein